MQLREKLMWKCINKKRDLVLENPEDFDLNEFRKLRNEFRIQTEGTKPNPETLLNYLINWANEVISNNVPLQFEYYRRLLRWCITEGNFEYSITDAASNLWKYLFGSPIPKFYEWNNCEKKYELYIDQWKEWYDQIRQKQK